MSACAAIEYMEHVRTPGVLAGASADPLLLSVGDMLFRPFVLLCRWLVSPYFLVSKVDNGTVALYCTVVQTLPTLS